MRDHGAMECGSKVDAAINAIIASLAGWKMATQPATGGRAAVERMKIHLNPPREPKTKTLAQGGSKSVPIFLSRFSGLGGSKHWYCAAMLANGLTAIRSLRMSMDFSNLNYSSQYATHSH